VSVRDQRLLLLLDDAGKGRMDQAEFERRYELDKAIVGEEDAAAAIALGSTVRLRETGYHRRDTRP
jgi:hypothetical protein